MFLGKSKRKRIDSLKNDSEKEETKDKVRDINIEVTNDGQFLIIDIKDNCNILEYYETAKRLDVVDLITNNTLFDKGLEDIHKKKVYIFSSENIMYQIYSNEGKIYINERIIIDSEDVYIEERIIKIDKLTKRFIINRMKHDKFLSTFYVGGYDSSNPMREFFLLEEDTALVIAQEIIKNLNEIENIDKVIDLNEVCGYLVFDGKSITKARKLI